VGLGARAVRELAERHGIRPTKAFGQNFLVDPNMARAIAASAGVGPGDLVLEVGAGLGSLTVALAETGASVLAIEVDRRVVPALREALEASGRRNVRVALMDAMRADWSTALLGRPWTMVSNLPYNVAVPVVMRLLEEAPQVSEMLVMVQREVGERLAAGPGEEAYGAVSVKVAYFADARAERRVPPSVFWPAPKVESVLVRLVRRKRRPPGVDRERLFRVIDEGFAQRRKTMRNALVRLGLPGREALLALGSCGLEAEVRAEELSLEQFACLAGVVR
jgi:16S rRNA (adenine1518-N6/adenine1519-N6)-dimethyltransferase